MINTIETGIDIEVLGGIDIGIEIDKSISGILILVLILLRRASNIECHGMFTNHLCHENFSNFCLVLGILETVLKRYFLKFSPFHFSSHCCFCFL